MLSIIIPALNEENYLPKLLNSIKRQSFKDYEIIVADAGSKDRTREIAREYGCKVVAGGLPAAGRNEGAKAARGETLLFIDADVILPENFLETALEEFQARKLAVASFLVRPTTDSLFLQSVYGLYNLFAKLFCNIIPVGMTVLLASGEVHKKINGFDEGVKFGEDADYVRRASRAGRFGLLRLARVFISTRRWEYEGYFKTLLRYLIACPSVLFFGPAKSDIFRYRFDIYRKTG